jgi:iron-sulfur cluster repair protein YtfE (RIC family)
MNDNDDVSVRPRRPGDPEADLTTFRILHRAMRGEVRRLAALTAEQGERPFPPEREAALQRLLGPLTAEIHSHHAKEDEVLWPVVAASAGAAIDLRPLSEEHAENDPCHDQIRAARGRERAEALASLRDLLDEHITEEEKVLFPVLLRYVSAEDFTACEKQFQKSASFSHLRFLLPFIADYAAPEELESTLKTGGPPMRILLWLFRPGYRRLQRAVYGS